MFGHERPGYNVEEMRTILAPHNLSIAEVSSYEYAFGRILFSIFNTIHFAPPHGGIILSVLYSLPSRRRDAARRAQRHRLQDPAEVLMFVRSCQAFFKRCTTSYAPTTASIKRYGSAGTRYRAIAIGPVSAAKYATSTTKRSIEKSRLSEV